MTVGNIENVVSPASFPEITNPVTGSKLIIILDPTTNPKLRQIDPFNVGGGGEYLLNGVSIGKTNKVNYLGDNISIVDNLVDGWFDISVGFLLQDNNVNLPVRGKINFLPPVSGSGLNYILTDNPGQAKTDIQLFGDPFLVNSTFERRNKSC